MNLIEKAGDTDVEALQGLGSSGDDQSTITKSTAIEVDQELEETLKKFGLILESDGCLNWRMDASVHPRNWSVTRRTFDTSVLLALDLYTTAISTSGPSMAQAAMKEMDLGHIKYQFGQALGGVVFPPYSECFGRKSVYIATTLVYCLACILTAEVPTMAGVCVGRFICGIMSAVPSVVVEGSIEDLFNMKSRVWIVFLWACATTAGLVLGPIYGAYISAYCGWKWVLITGAIVTGVFTLLLFGIRESRPSRLLAQQAAKLQQEKGISYPIHSADVAPSLATFSKIALIRPLRLFFTEPIVFCVSIIASISWGLIYLFAESLPSVYASLGFTGPSTSLAFIPLLLGIPLSILFRIQDQRALRHREQANLALNPEQKLTGFVIAAPALAIGLWIFAWTIPPAVPHLHWAVSMIGLVLVGFATNEFACTLSGYLADSYTIYASSAFAALAFLRAVLAGIFPLFAPRMYSAMGQNQASTVLAAVATCFCGVAVLFMKYGKAVRQKSKFAGHSLMVNKATQVKGDNVE
ncbi:hypothetical protein V495_00970 [Pseudogymnoascus sp. VKM F-4514 (FW-929)]|nr:hypothetical protein V495_00970 [Pseudogymnoascus sp. VKM F-4514 (FW-929)]KFY51153.1 hypothetical protein V497_09343 [Pseudogymnoascus sp. VKM F-4516 (FW-969)]